MLYYVSLSLYRTYLQQPCLRAHTQTKHSLSPSLFLSLSRFSFSTNVFHIMLINPDLIR